MNKELVAIGFLLVFLMIGLTGCNDGQVSEFEMVKLVNYSVESWEMGEPTSIPNSTMNLTYHGDDFIDMPKVVLPIFTKIGDGFIGMNQNVDYYKISGTVKNKFGYKADIKVILRFYDENGMLLDSDHIIVQDIPKSTMKSFTKYYIRPSINNWSKVNEVKFEFE